MNLSIGGEPQQEPSPGGITITLGEFPIFHEVGNLHVFIDNQIVR